MTRQLFALFTEVGAEWVMYLLIALSILSVGLILERLVFFLRYSSARTAGLIPLLGEGRLEEARTRLSRERGFEAMVTLAALDAASGGPSAVQEAIACAVARERPAFERSLSFLGTLGNNAPFLGLFGTVVGIIKAFADLSVGGLGSGKAAGAAAVMSGISEALVATAVGIFVAMPAVVAFNSFNRWLKTVHARAQALGHALVGYLERDEVRADARRRLEVGPQPQAEPLVHSVRVSEARVT